MRVCRQPQRKEAFSTVFLRAAAALALVLVVTGNAASAQTNSAGRPPENRYLLVVETSRSMQRRLDGLLQSTKELLDSGMGGRIRRGDTLGLWTFNEEVYAGRFPLQEWSTEEQGDIAAHVLAFLKAQKYEKQARLDRVLPSLDRVLKSSEFLTVVVVSDGQSALQGSPFDKQVNDVFAAWRSQQQQSRMPFVTVLRAEHGKFTAYASSPAPSRVEWPALAQELLPKKGAPKSLPVASAAPKPPTSAPVTLPPLIISGKKSGSKAVLEPSSSSATTSSNTSPALNTGAAGMASMPPALKDTSSLADRPASLAANPQPAPGPFPKLASAVSPSTQPTKDAPELQPAPANREPASVPASPSVASDHGSASVLASPEVRAPNGIWQLQPAPEPPLEPQLAETESKPKLSGEEAGIVENAMAPMVKDSPPTDRPEPLEVVSEEDPSPPPFGSKNLFLIILGGVAVAMALVRVYGMRSQVPPLASLITESLDKKQGVVPLRRGGQGSGYG